jgi:hypothetical protein
MQVLVWVFSLVASGSTISNSNLPRKAAVAVVHVFKHPPKPAAVVCDKACLAAMQEPEAEPPEVAGVEEPGGVE